MKPGDELELVGLDVGSTTLRGLRVRAQRVVSATTGLAELVDARVVSRLPVRLTPFTGADLHVEGVLAAVDTWLTGGAPAGGGGVLLTGLAARAPSAGLVAEALRQRVGDGVVLTASDPRLEAWVAFMSRARALSEARPDACVVNLDVGGGTTNVAWGRAGSVVRTASLYVGARHVRLDPMSRRVVQLTQEAVRLCAEAGLSLGQGDACTDEHAAAIVRGQVQALEQLVAGEEVVEWLVQAGGGDGGMRNESTEAVLMTISGGVGDLVEAIRGGEDVSAAAAFGDLGPELARGIAASTVLSAGAGADGRGTPGSAGQATVWGLTLHATALSGATVFLGAPGLLPRRDLPIVARVDTSRGDAAGLADALAAALGLARSAPAGGALMLDGVLPALASVRLIGGALADAIARVAWPADRLLVVLIGANAGQALGSYATAWGRRPAPLIVLDQVPLCEAKLVTLGKPANGMVPVAFSGVG